MIIIKKIDHRCHLGERPIMTPWYNMVIFINIPNISLLKVFLLFRFKSPNKLFERYIQFSNKLIQKILYAIRLA